MLSRCGENVFVEHPSCSQPAKQRGRVLRVLRGGVPPQWWLAQTVSAPSSMRECVWLACQPLQLVRQCFVQVAPAGGGGGSVKGGGHWGLAWVTGEQLCAICVHCGCVEHMGCIQQVCACLGGRGSDLALEWPVALMSAPWSAKEFARPACQQPYGCDSRMFWMGAQIVGWKFLHACQLLLLHFATECRHKPAVCADRQATSPLILQPYGTCVAN